MNHPFRILVAALATAGAATLATAQSANGTATPTPVTLPNQPGSFVAEPVASASRSSGTNADVANAIAQALNADAQLKGSKLSVVAEDNGVLLTGVTPTVKQMGRAMQVAAQAAGEASVSSVISTEEVYLDAPHPVAELSVVQPQG